MAFTFTSQVAALASPTTVDTFKTALDADLASLETGVGITSAVLALPTNHVPADFYAAFMADIQALANKGVPLSLANATGRESWSTFMTNLKSDWGLLVNYFSTPTLSINNVSLTEGNTGTKYATFTVSLSHAYHQNVSFDYATADGSATVANNDYIATSDTGATIPAGSTSYSINVPIIGDTVYEGDETFTLTLSNVSNAIVGTATGTGTILNDDVLTYLMHALFDVANQPLSAGDLNTQAPGSVQNGALTVYANGGTPEIAGGLFKYTGTTASSAWDRGIQSQSIAKSFGRGLLLDFLSTNSTAYFRAGFANSTDMTNPVAYEAGLAMHGTSMYANVNNNAVLLGSMPSSNTQYQMACILGGADVNGAPYQNHDSPTGFDYGASLFMKGGAFTNWTLLWRDNSANTAALYARAQTYADTITVDNMRVPDADLSSLLQPADLDTFDGYADGTDVTTITPDVGGNKWGGFPGLSMGTPTVIVGGRMQGQSGNVEWGALKSINASSYLLQFDLTLAFYYYPHGVYLYYQDANNWLKFYASGGAEYFPLTGAKSYTLVKSVNGTHSVLATSAADINWTANVSKRITVRFDAGHFQLWVDSALEIDVTGVSMPTPQFGFSTQNAASAFLDNIVVYPLTSMAYDSLLAAV